MNNKKILVVDDDLEVGDLVETTLENDGHSVIRAENGLQGWERAREHKPDLVVMDIDMPIMDGLELCQKLRKEKGLHLVPIIMLTGSKTHPEDRIEGLKIGADDYILKPFLPPELSIRVNRLLCRTEEHMSVNPLTKLPGSYTLETEVLRRIEQDKTFGACYFDLDHFKAFNDHYGYKWGDDIIKFLAGLLTRSVTNNGSSNDFLVHIGGDDFVVLTTPEKVDPICEEVIKQFSKEIDSYYSDLDKQRNCIITFNRRGRKEGFPLMSLSVAVATNEHRNIKHYIQLVDILSELKKYAKKKKGNYIARDRRQDKHDG